MLKIFNSKMKLAEKANVIKQKQEIDAHFPYLKCTILWSKVKLKCRGVITSDITGTNFVIEISYKPFYLPQVKILNPKIPARHEIHVFDDGSLCLYHKSEINWNNKSMMYDTTIPRIAEWIMYYELWQLTGEWEGPEYPHPTIEKKK